MTSFKTLLKIANNIVTSVPINIGFKVKPKYLWLETTDRCNSRCVTCNIWKKSPTDLAQTYSLKDLSNLLNSELMSDIKYVLNSGGETTLVRLEDYLLIEHEALPNAILQISSNALLPERLTEIVQYAMDIGVKHLDVGLSIDGIGDSHDKIRGVKGCFAKLEQTITSLSILREKYPGRIWLSMGSTLTDTTAKEYGLLYNYAEKVKIPFMWHWFNTSAFYENKNTNNDVGVGVFEVIRDYPYKNLYMDYWLKSIILGEIPHFKCRSLQTFMAIKCNGDIVPCLSRWDEPIGNIKQQSIENIWQSVQANMERCKVKKCNGCLNSWGWGWSVNETYYPVLIDVIKRKFLRK